MDVDPLWGLRSPASRVLMKTLCAGDLLSLCAAAMLARTYAQVLRAQLYKLERERAASAASADRMAQAGSGDRSEKIRTYNFPQGRVTDHRVGVTQNDIEAVLAGERLDEFIDAMQQLQQRESLASLQGV